MLVRRAVLISGLVALLAVASCRDDSVRPPAAVEGQWGATHVNLVADAQGGAIEYDCASGRIDAALVLDADGDFDVEGTHTRDAGGPVRVGQKPDVHPARYKGHVSKDTLTLTVTLTDTGDVFGPYTLVRGGQAILFKCL